MQTDRQELAKALNDYLQARSWSERGRLVEAHPELLTTEADELMKEALFVAYRANPAEGEHTEVLRRILLRSRELGTAQAFHEMQRMTALYELITDYFGAGTDEAKQYYLQTHPGLLSAEVDAMLQNVDDPAVAKLRQDMSRHRVNLWEYVEEEFRQKRQEFAKTLAFYDVSPATLPPIPSGPVKVCLVDQSHKFIGRTGVRRCPYCGGKAVREERPQQGAKTSKS